MGYQFKTDTPHNIATHVQIEIDAHDLIYIDLIKRRLNRNIIRKDDKIEWNVHGRELKISIVNVESPFEPNLPKKINSNTQFSFKKCNSPTIELPKEDQQDAYISSLREMMCSSLKNSEAYHKLGISVVKSILVHGVSGVGKTRLAKLVSGLFGCTLYEISIHDLLLFNEEEYDLSEFRRYNPFTLLLNKAIELQAPATIIVRDLDALSSNNNKTTKILDILSKEVNRIVDMGPSCPIIIIGLASCQLRSLSQALQNSDIFGQHLLIPIPTIPQRKALLEHFLKDLNLEKIESIPNTVDYYATQISMKTPGYVARDLKLLVRQAKLKALRSNDSLVEQFEQLSIGKDEKRKPVVRLSDFEYSLETYRPSQQIGMTLESLISKKKKAKSWDDLGGYEKIKDRIKQAVLLPMLQPDIFTKLGVKPPSGLLLYGPSGCGKTALAQALMSESMMNVISIRGPEIFSKYLGETEHKIRTLFSTAKRNSRSIVFIDEMDSIAMKRGFDMNDGNSSGGVNERVLSTLLNEIDGVEGRQDVILICCTNRPDQIDDALLRPGRLDQLIYIGLPSLEDRINIIKTLVKSIAVDDTIDPVELAKQTEFCTGADLESLFREAGTIALREDLNAKYISKHHIQQVLTPILEKAEDQILDGSLDLYERFLHEHHQ